MRNGKWIPVDQAPHEEYKCSKCECHVIDDQNVYDGFEYCDDVKGGYCCRQCSHTRINKDGIWCENPTCQWEQAVTTCEPCDDANKSEIPTSCDDAISREAVEGLMTNWMFFSPSHKAEAEKELSELPSVQPSRKGHWIETEYHRYRCPICREKGMSDWDNIHDKKTDFCPNCGADMRGDAE